MHSVTLPDGSRVKDHWIKWMRVLAYSLMGTSGALLLLSPVLTEMYTGTAEVMSWFLLVGGTFCTIGALFERWWGEYIGIPLLASSFMVFAVISFAQAIDVAAYLAWANLTLLIAVGLGLLSRWKDVRTVYRLAVHMAEKPPEEALSDE